MRTLPYGTQKNKNSQAYGSGDGGGSNIVQGAHQPALPDCRRNLLEGRGRRGGDRQARFFPGCRHRPLYLSEILAGAVIHDTHDGERKCSGVQNQNYLKNKVNLKLKR